MSKLQKYNRVIFAIISVPTLIAMLGLTFLIIREVLPRNHRDYDQNNGVIAKAEAAKNIEKQEYSQYISYNNMFMLNSENQEFVVPVIARTMEKKERYTESFRFMNEAVVDEVAFDDSGVAELSTSMSANENGARRPTPIKKPDTTSFKGFYTEQFVNLVYENGASKIHKSLINERFTGWELNYIRIGKKRYLAFIGTTKDSNGGGYLNREDYGDLYLYDVDTQETKVINIPDMEISDYFLMKNNPILILAVRDTKRPETHRNEQFIYRYNINTGKLDDIIPNEEKQQHLKLIMQ